MRSTRLCAALLSLGLLACSSSTSTTGTTGGSANISLAGTWTITKYEFVSVAKPATRTDVIALGYTATLVGTTTGWTITAVLNGQPAAVQIGTYTSTATTAVFTTTNQTPNKVITFAASQSGNTLTLTGGVASYDFGAGDEPATVNLTLVKQ